MNVTETSAEGLKRELTITVPASEVEDQVTRRLGEIGRAARIPGFRPGKVPLALLRRRFGPAVRGEVLESTVQDSSAEAMRTHNLRPALPPKVAIVSAAEGADLEYTMSLELLPEMPEPDFTALGLERLVADVAEEEIDRAVGRIAEAQRKTEPVARPAQTGDILIANVVGRTGDAEIAGSRGEGRQIELGAEGLLPGFTEQLTGIGAGETREVRVTFPEDYGNPELAGKEGVFEVAVTEVRERQPTVIDDELAKAVGLETLAELRQEIQQGIARDYAQVARQRLKRGLLDKLAERYDFAVPPGMVEMEFGGIWAQYEAEKARRGETAGAEGAAAGIAAEGTTESAAESTAPIAEAASELPVPALPETGVGEALPTPEEGEDEEKTKADFRRIAERRVRLGLLIGEVGRGANITVSQEELNQALLQQARRLPGYERQVIDFYRKNPEALDRLRGPIFEDKVVDFIIELAKPAERKVTSEELMRADEPESASAA